MGVGKHIVFPLLSKWKILEDKSQQILSLSDKVPVHFKHVFKSSEIYAQSVN